MSKQTLFKVGIFITITLAALIWGLSFLKGNGVFNKEATYNVIYNRIDGLQVSNPVVLNGFKIGAVKDIRFTNDTSGNLLVELSIQRDVILPKLTTARIFSSDLMGNKSIEILLGDKKEIHMSGDTLDADFEGSLKELVSLQMIPIKNQAESLMKELADAVNVVNDIFNEKTKKDITSSINRLNNTFYNLDTIVYTSKDKIEITLSNIEKVSTMLKNNNENISHTLSNLSSISDSLMISDIKETIANTNMAMAQLAEISAKINSGEGTAGHLLNNDTLYYNLEELSYNLNLLVEDLKENPERYVHLSLFGDKISKKSK